MGRLPHIFYQAILHTRSASAGDSISDSARTLGCSGVAQDMGVLTTEMHDFLQGLDESERACTLRERATTDMSALSRAASVPDDARVSCGCVVAAARYPERAVERRPVSNGVHSVANYMYS